MRSMLTPSYVAIDRLAASGRPYIRAIETGETGLRYDRALRLLGHLTRRWKQFHTDWEAN